MSALAWTAAVSLAAWLWLLPFTAFLYLLMTVDSAVRHHRGRGGARKGRTYPRPGAVPGPDEG